MNFFRALFRLFRRKPIRPVYTWPRFDSRDFSQHYYHSASRRHG